MRVAYVHVLPLEYYPPATNTLDVFSRQTGWSVHAWTSDNERNMKEWKHPEVRISRFQHGSARGGILRRSAAYAAWHLRAAAELSRWKPDVVIAVEPHSTLAVWLYYSMFRGDARLFVHHHEYYAPEDFKKPGMRLLKSVNRIERDGLLERAVWVSQTNSTRLRLMMETHPRVRPSTAHVLPNYPTSSWIERASPAPRLAEPGRTRLVYVGSASFEDTFIREVTEWVMQRPRDFSLHIAGNNLSPDVSAWLDTLRCSNIAVAPDGYPYEALPEILATYDAGLVLYKGNTLNFVHNVPNKAAEYLACGLETWYPPEMQGMKDFHREHPNLRLREVNFMNLPESMPRVHNLRVEEFPFSCESALAPMITEIEARR